MKKLIALLSVSTVALFLSSGSGDAQDKKKSGPSKQGSIELIESKDGKFRFSVRNGEGKYLAGSPVGHESEKEAPRLRKNCGA